MEDLIRKAEDLGRSLADHERFKALIEARDAVRADDEGRRLMQQYQQQAEKVQRLAVEGKPIEPDDKRELSRLEQQAAGNDLIKALSKAQADFQELMNRVNQAIYSKIAAPPSEGDTPGEGEQHSTPDNSSGE